MGEVAVFGGRLWDEHLLYRPSVRLDEEQLSSGLWHHIDNGLAIASDKLGTMSGFYGIKGVEQVLTVQLMTNQIMKGIKKGIKPKDLSRLTDIGLNEKVLARMQNNLKHVEFNKAGAVDKLNLDRWDLATRDDFINSLHRGANQIVQRGFVGESSFWMHSNLGALLAQFRQFPILAMEKQTGRHMLHRDAQTAMFVAYGTAFSAVASLGKAYVMSLGRTDQNEYLAKRLEPDMLLASALNYNPAVALFGDITNMVVGEMGGGFGTGGVQRLMPPTFTSTLDAAAVPFSMARTLINGEGIRKNDLRKAWRAFPLMNTPATQILGNTLSNIGSDPQ
jgi:hypothetical protein